LVIEPVFARRRIDGHPADGIQSIKAMMVVVVTMIMFAMPTVGDIGISAAAAGTC
jgi:hypothetical protein